MYCDICSDSRYSLRASRRRDTRDPCTAFFLPLLLGEGEGSVDTGLPPAPQEDESPFQLSLAFANLEILNISAWCSSVLSQLLCFFTHTTQQMCQVSVSHALNPLLKASLA